MVEGYKHEKEKQTKNEPIFGRLVVSFHFSFDEVRLENSSVDEVLTDQDFLDSFEHKVDVLFICGTCSMHVNLLGVRSDVEELLLYVFDSSTIFLASLVFREAPAE